MEELLRELIELLRKTRDAVVAINLREAEKAAKAQREAKINLEDYIQRLERYPEDHEENKELLRILRKKRNSLP